MNLSHLRSIVSTAGSIVIPSAKLCVGIWFLKHTASCIWKWTKAIIELSRKGQPRFASGRVDKFYKCTPPRLRKRRQKEGTQNERRQRKRRQIQMRSLATMETVVEESTIKSNSLLLENIDLNELVKEQFALCACEECVSGCGVTSMSKRIKPDFKDVYEEKSFVKEMEQVDYLNDSHSIVREMHERVVKDIGLKCIVSSVPNDHNHSSCSLRETPVQGEEEVIGQEFNSNEYLCDDSLPSNVIQIQNTTITFLEGDESQTPCPTFSVTETSSALGKRASCERLETSQLSDEESFEMDSNFDFSEAMVENNSVDGHLVEACTGDAADLDLDINDLFRPFAGYVNSSKVEDACMNGDKESRSMAVCEEEDCSLENENASSVTNSTCVEAGTSSTDTSNEEDPIDNSVESEDIYIHVSYK